MTSDAVAALAAAQRPRLVAIGLRVLRDRDEAEDVASDTILTAMAWASRLRAETASAWLGTVAYHAALARAKQRNRAARASDLDACSDPAAAGAYDDVLDRLARATSPWRRRVLAELARMSPRRRAIMLAFYDDGQTKGDGGGRYRRLAAEFGCSPAGINSHLSKGRTRLYEAAVNARGDTPT